MGSSSLLIPHGIYSLLVCFLFWSICVHIVFLHAMIYFTWHVLWMLPLKLSTQSIS